LVGYVGIVLVWVWLDVDVLFVCVGCVFEVLGMGEVEVVGGVVVGFD